MDFARLQLAARGKVACLTDFARLQLAARGKAACNDPWTEIG